MATPFPDTLRFLEADHARALRAVVLLALLLLVAWGFWFAFGHISVVEPSLTATLQGEGAATIAAPAGGQITTLRVASGQHVQAGELLLTLATEDGPRRVRAPASGYMRQMARLSLGSDVRAGDSLGIIIAPGPLRVVATFPADTLGRIQPGQPARLQIERRSAAPRSVAARVREVVQDSQSRQIRVVLALAAEPEAINALQHGLPARVDVEVEQVAPAALILRAIGQRRVGEQ